MYVTLAGGVSSAQSVTIINDGVSPLTITGVDIIGSDGDEFTNAGDGCKGTTLAKSATCAVSIRFKPLISASPVATLRITSNSPTSSDTVTLDPPAYTTSTGAAAAGKRTPRPAATCTLTRRHHHAIVACTVPPGHGPRTIRARLQHAGHLYATATTHTTSTHLHLRLHARRPLTPDATG